MQPTAAKSPRHVIVIIIISYRSEQMNLSFWELSIFMKLICSNSATYSLILTSACSDADAAEHVRDMGWNRTGCTAHFPPKSSRRHSQLCMYVEDQRTGISVLRKGRLGIGNGMLQGFLWDHLPVHQVMLYAAQAGPVVCFCQYRITEKAG